ncbi:MAG: hypothetical protein HFG69_15220 [Hungatella sp.]|nr:hypothetical protein [Hungatella sp.]
MAKKLWVKMFGGFSVRYGDEVLGFGRQRDSKFAQLFQILMTRPGMGFDKGAIMRFLYGREEVEVPNASLNNTIFRLRKYLETSPLPEGNYLILNEGVLRFDIVVPVESDVWRFESIIQEFEREQDRQKKAEFCKDGFELYQGEFLPQLSSEQWVIEKSKDYKEMYFELLNYLLPYLKEERDYRSIENMSARATELYPFEGWESWRIESLIALGHYKEAEKVYQETAAYVQEIGGFLSKNQQTRFYKLGDGMRHPEGRAEDIRRYLMEQEGKEGAYSCTLPGFLDCFRVVKRTAARKGTICFILLLCTILDAGGCPADDREYCKKQGKKLCSSFKAYLRRGDIYTKYSESQYLLLCIGAGRENVPDIGTRIDKDYRKRCGGRGSIGYRLLDDGNME